jgi:hypothetical protein
VCETWIEGKPRPFALSGITVLDTENARVYVEGENEILFLPPEVNCLTRLGKLYTSVGIQFQAKADAITAAHLGEFGALYDGTTAAGRLVRLLTTYTTKMALPTEFQIRGAAHWDANLDRELRQLEAELAQSPPVLSAKLNRVAASVEAAAASLSGASICVDDNAVSDLARRFANKLHTAKVAASLADEQIGSQPVTGTGGEVWKQLYRYAREFAAEAGLRQVEELFEVGDPCPLCQRPLDEESTARLAAFDAFVEGKASADARAAAKAVDERIATLTALTFKSDAELGQLLSEYATSNGEAEHLVASAIRFNAGVMARRDLLVKSLRNGEMPTLEALSESPVQTLIDTAERLRGEARAILEGNGIDTKAATRATELRDQKRLHDQRAEVLDRREALEHRLKLLECVAAVNTLPVSRLATAIRKELVTPELSKRISDELEELALGHIPLRFGEKTDRGTSFFEVALATEQRADKRQVLSEGEQRALSIACFLAESHVAGRQAGIVFDDPVTSLDHKRLRRVAERLVREAASGRQIIIFTHNLLFYQEVLRACADRSPQVPVLPCLVRQQSAGEFGLVTNGDQPWIAKKVKERERHLDETIKAIPDDLPQDSETFRLLAKSFYTDLRETWERAVEEILFNAVVERFGTDVKTQSLRAVEVTNEDYRIIFHAMKGASEYSGHDRAAGRQLDPPSKEQMRKDLLELIGFRATRQKRRLGLEEDRKKLEGAPAAKTA